MKGLKNGLGYADLIGKQVNRWTVLSLATTTGRTRLLCRCACGTERTVDGACIRMRSTISCGCYQREVETYPAGLAEHRDLLHRYQAGANKRRVVWELSEEQFLALIARNCTYCGDAPYQIIRYKGKNTAFLYNGLDRVHNATGYTTANTVPCCEMCNKAKRDLPVEVFVGWISRIHAHVMNRAAEQLGRRAV